MDISWILDCTTRSVTNLFSFPFLVKGVKVFLQARTLTQPFAYDKYKDRKLMEEVFITFRILKFVVVFQVEKERDMTVVKKKNEKNEVKVSG